MILSPLVLVSQHVLPISAHQGVTRHELHQVSESGCCHLCPEGPAAVWSLCEAGPAALCQNLSSPFPFSPHLKIPAESAAFLSVLTHQLFLTKRKHGCPREVTRLLKHKNHYPLSPLKEKNTWTFKTQDNYPFLRMVRGNNLHPLFLLDQYTSSATHQERNEFFFSFWPKEGKIDRAILSR